VLGGFPSRLNWDHPTLSPAVECPPPFGSGAGGAHLLAGQGVGGPNSDEGTDTRCTCTLLILSNLI
jgi:hypothetical protein